MEKNLNYTEYKRNKITAIKSDILARLGGEIKKLSESYQSSASEAIDDLAYACTFKNPRRFKGIVMTSEKFLELSQELTLSQLLEAANARQRCIDPNRRLFYVLGVYARIYAHSAPMAAFTDYKQRRYSAADMALITADIENFDNIEI